MRIIGLIIVLGVGLSGGALVESRLSYFPIIISLFLRPVGIVIVFSLGALLLGRTSIPTMFKVVFSREVTGEELTTGAAAWARARTYTMTAGWIGVSGGLLLTVRGLIITFRGIAESGWAPTIMSAGLSMALTPTMVGLQFLFCAVLLAYGIYMPLQRRLEDRIGQASES